MLKTRGPQGHAEARARCLVGRPAGSRGQCRSHSPAAACSSLLAPLPLQGGGKAVYMFFLISSD